MLLKEQRLRSLKKGLNVLAKNITDFAFSMSLIVCLYLAKKLHFRSKCIIFLFQIKVLVNFNPFFSTQISGNKLNTLLIVALDR